MMREYKGCFQERLARHIYLCNDVGLSPLDFPVVWEPLDFFLILWIFHVIIDIVIPYLQ